VLAGINPAIGFVGFGVVGSVVMDLIGVERVRGRDLATGIVLGASIGLAALFLYLAATTTATTGATQYILFGSIFATTTSTTVLVVVFSVISLGLISVVHRPLLLTSVSADVAATKGVPVRLVGMLFMVALAIAVGLSSIAIGSILSTALLIGPAATALRLTRTMGATIGLACLIGVGGTWLGVLLAYDSAYWGSSHEGLPVSFFIVSILFVAYLASSFWEARSAGRRRLGRV
jgi:zinc/manganese transport system permease protein